MGCLICNIMTKMKIPDSDSDREEFIAELIGDLKQYHRDSYDKHTKPRYQEPYD